MISEKVAITVLQYVLESVYRAATRTTFKLLDRDARGIDAE